jgi:hypothetical protein
MVGANNVEYYAICKLSSGAYVQIYNDIQQVPLKSAQLINFGKYTLELPVQAEFVQRLEFS